MFRLSLTRPLATAPFRGTGDELGIPIITYETGEALRFGKPVFLPVFAVFAVSWNHWDSLPNALVDEGFIM